MKQNYVPATVISLKKMTVDSKIYELVLAPQNFSPWVAGQFIMIHLRRNRRGMSFARPFSIASTNNEHITLYIQVQGKETAQIQDYKKGDTLHLWGPLGSTFSAPTKPTLLIAGGIGIAPFVSYVSQYNSPNIHMLFGHRLPLAEYPFPLIAERASAEACESNVATSLRTFIERIQEAMLQYKDGQVLACGPLPLLRTVQQYAKEHSIDTEISLEEQMYCGIGVCLGCVCKTTETYPEERLRSTYIQSCTYGAIFKADTIIL